MQNSAIPQSWVMCRPFRVALPDGRAYWTVVDEHYRVVPELDSYLFELRFGRDRAESTTRMYASGLARFDGWRRSTDRDWATAARELSRFVLHLRVTPVARRGAAQDRLPSAERVNHVLTVVREFFKHAVAQGAVNGDVLASLYEVADDRYLPRELRVEGGGLRYRARPRHRLRTQRSQRPSGASVEEWEAMLVAARSWRDRFLLVLLWFTGLRIGEALGLRRSDVHFMESATSLGCRVPGPHLHVVRRDNPNGAWAKSRRDRVVPASSWVLAYYDRYLAERSQCRPADRCDFVFVNLFHAPLGMPMTLSAARQRFVALGERAGLERRVTAHMFRHSLATELLESGQGIDVVQVLLGHASITSTQVYVHPSDRRMREAVESLDAKMSIRQARTKPVKP